MVGKVTLGMLPLDVEDEKDLPKFSPGCTWHHRARGGNEDSERNVGGWLKQRRVSGEIRCAEGRANHLFEGLRRKHEADEVEELEGKANGDDVPAKEWGADGVSVVARGITIRKLIEHSRQRTVSDLGLVPQLLLEGVCSIKEVKCLRERLHYLQRGGGVTPRNDAEIAVASQQTQSWWDKQGLRTCVPVRP